MKIAREFSVLMGHNIEFDELIEEEKRLKERQEWQERQEQELPIEDDRGINCPPLTSAGSKQCNLLSSRGLGRKDHSYDDSDGNSDSSDSEIEGYDLPAESPEDFLPLTNYLRVCLELLLASDADKDAHDKQLAALKSVPRIVLTNPVDACDVCGPLLRELLRLNNNFNMEEFDTLRDCAVQSLLVTYPEIAAPVLAWAVEEESFSISMRIFAIASLSKAAFSLSGLLNIKQVPEAEVQLDQSKVSKERGKRKEIEDEKKAVLDNSVSNSSNSLRNDPRSESTTVKRPLKLAADARKKVYVVNKFGLVGPLFYYPILRLLAVTISNINSNEMKKEKMKQIAKNSVPTKISFTSDENSFEGSFIRNSLIAKSNKKKKSKNGGNGEVGVSRVSEEREKDEYVSFDDEVGDGLQSMIPVQALLALACFVKCSVNSVCQR